MIFRPKPLQPNLKYCRLLIRVRLIFLLPSQKPAEVFHIPEACRIWLSQKEQDPLSLQPD